jgi:hypothetical protein
MRAFGRAFAAAVAILVLAAWPSLSTADCNGGPPSFRDTVTEARRVVIGDVVSFKPGEPHADGRSAQPANSWDSIMDACVCVFTCQKRQRRRQEQRS